MTPIKLAEAAKKSATKNGVKIKILDEKNMRKLGMGAVLGVARGSAEKPRFIILEYMKGPKNQKPLVLAGKGVTFDTGGLNLKPEAAIYEMHMDMSGGAAVIHTIAALARLGVKKNIIGLVPAVENMPSGSSYHPGDLLRTMSGKTIEVLNTDAEGRIILAASAMRSLYRSSPGMTTELWPLVGGMFAQLC
jgi:leucyl aminopeptidase